MGGKTQQRVAGNAKPSNSGRIRELLTNQHNVGNVITFSALANSKKTGQSSNKVESAPASNDPTNVEVSPSQNTPASPSRENCRLIVKRVGNRDLYTRVRISDDQIDNNDLKEVPATFAGVKKPPELDNRLENNIDTPIQNTEIIEEQQHDEDKIEELNFFTILEQLNQAQESLSSNAVDSLSELSEGSIANELELMRLLKILVEKFSKELSLEDWDLLVRSLYKWVDWISKSTQVREPYQREFAVNVFEFINQMILFAQSLKKESRLEEECPMLQSLLDDWGNFHSSNMFQDLIVLFFRLVSFENSSEKPDESLIEALANIVISVDPRIALSHHSLLDYFSTEIKNDTDFEAPSNSIYCLIDKNKFKGFLAVCGLLRSNIRTILVSSHAILRKTIENICENVSAIISDQDDIDDAPIFPPEALMSILTSRDSVMSALLSDYRVGDISVTIEPNTDSYACTLGYLFIWDLVIKFIVGIDKEVGHKIIHSFKRFGLIQRLLDNIFMLLPPLGERDSLNFRIYSADKDIKTHRDSTWSLSNYLKSPLETSIKRPINEIELIALHLYFSVALHMPVTVRKWYNNNSNKRLCNLVNEYTVKHVSQIICSLEMESVQEKCQERASQDGSKNLVIKARASAKEVYAIYTRDEFKMELTIKLPVNYPLEPVQIDAGKRVGVTDVKWRSWLLQLTTFLSHQNGPILDGIDLWRRNIDKRFEGIEKCTICFSILHSNYQLPKKKCQNCFNMFHNLCLYKWFESSGNSTCPLCRNPW